MATRGGGVPALPRITCGFLFFVAVIATIIIKTAEELKSIANNVATFGSVTYRSTGLFAELVADSPVKYIRGNYELGGDIDLSGESDFIGIGSILVPFAGSFDGKGHTVKLAINTTQNNVGLFGYVGVNKDHVTTGANQTAVDGLHATIDIKNIGVTGTITSTLSNVGGLIGWMNGGEVIGYSEVDVTGYDNLGSLVGRQIEGSIIGYATGDVTSNINSTSQIGGLVGQQILGGSIIGYATGNVDVSPTAFWVGGFIGNLRGTVTGYSMGVITTITATTTDINGFVGNLASGTVNGGYFDRAAADIDDGGTGITSVTAAANIYKFTGTTETMAPNRVNGKFYDNKGNTDATDDTQIFNHADFVANFDLDSTPDGKFPKLKTSVFSMKQP